MRPSIALLSVFMVALMSCAARGQDGSGWPTEALITQISTLAGGKTEVQSGNGPPRNLLIDPTEEQACFLRPGDTVRYVQHGDAGTAVLIGDDRITHTIQFYYPVVTVSGNDDAPEFYRGIFRYLLPRWAGAEEWPLKSVSDSWNITGQAMVDPSISIDQTIARHSEGNVRLATNGVPPDVAWLRVTTRSECEKVSPYLLASPREPLKTKEFYRPSSQAQLLLTYIHPVPVDVSAAPFLLGSSRSGRDGAVGTTVTFEYPGVAVDTADWIDLQAKGERYASTTAAVEEFWGYQHMHLHLIREPAIPTKIGEGRGLAVIEKLNSWARKSTKGVLSIEPFDVEAVFFSATTQDRPSVAAQDITFGGGDFVQFDRGPHSVDVSDTPIYLGRMHLYYPGHSGDKPGFYAIEPDGLGLSVHDRLSSAEARIDFSRWASSNGVDSASIGGHLMTDPVIAFELKGKSHALVLESIMLDREGAGRVMFMTGHLFVEK